MTPKQVGQFCDRITAWYPKALLLRVDVTDANPYGLCPRVQHVWCEDLAPLPAEIAVEALKRYARKDKYGNPPSPDDILHHAEAIEDERRRAEIQQRRAEEQRQALEAWQQRLAAQSLPYRPQEPRDILGRVLQSAASDPWAHAFVQMVVDGIACPGREAEAIRYCETKAQEQPEARDAWIAEARHYDRRRLQATVYPQDGHRYVPDMTGNTVIEEPVGVREPGEEADDEEETC